MSRNQPQTAFRKDPMQITLSFLAPALMAAALAGPALAGCGTAPGPCLLPGGEYDAALPEGASGALPAVVFIHGYGSSGDATMSNRGMVEAILARGYAVIAPSGLKMEGREGRSWGFHPDWPHARDDIAFLKAVRDDATARFGLDPARILLAGFSVGGSMVSYLACAEPQAFAAYAPVSGGFWRPHPAGCTGPVRLLHTHGWVDTTVPLEGRILREVDEGEEIAQGDIFHTLEIWRAANGCNELRADRFSTSGEFMTRAWDRCTKGSALEFALHPGGHMIPKGWATLALDWFEAL